MQLEALPCAHMVASRLATCSAPLLPWEHADRSYQHLSHNSVERALEGEERYKCAFMD